MLRRLPLALLLLGCSGGSDPDPATPDARGQPDAEVIDPTVLRVGGEYSTAVTLMSSSCTGITVMNNPTSVAHTPGATTLTLTHVGNSYPGTIMRNGEFATTPVAVGPSSETHTLVIGGDFSTTGFNATVAAQVSSNGQVQCAYSVRWVGTRGSGMNVIPE